MPFLSSIKIPPGIQDALSFLEGVGKQYLAWLGCALLLIGIFLPAKTYVFSSTLFSGGISGSVSLWDYAKFWSFVLILLIIASAVIAYARDYNWLLITGTLIFLILILNLLYTFSTGYDFSGYSAHPTWGWIVLLIGCLLVLAGGLVRSLPRDAQDDLGLIKLIGQSRGRMSGTGSR